MAISDLLPDFLSSAPTKNPYAGALSDEAWSYYEKMQKRQRVGNALRGVGDYLSRAAVGDYRVRPASGGGGQNDLMQMMQMQALLEKRQDRDAKRQRQETKDTANAAIIAKIRGLSGPVGPEKRVRGYPGAAPVTARALPPAQPMSGLRSDSDFIASLMATNPKIATGLMFPGPRKAPKTRRRIQGTTTIQEQFDPASGEFTEIGRGPRFKPGGGGITPAQQASNAKIDAARRELAAAGLSREDILSRLKKATDTGRENPDYDPFINRLVGTATQRKIGDDPEFESVFQRVYGVGDTAVSPADQAQGAAGSPGVPPSLLPPAPRRSPPTERELRRRSAGKPDIGETMTIQGKPYEVVKENSDGTLTVMDLQTGEFHRAAAERSR